LLKMNPKTAIKISNRNIERISNIAQILEKQKFFLFRAKKIRDRISQKSREANLTLAGKRISIPNSEKSEHKPQAHWAAINAERKKIAENGKSWNPEHIYNQARTFFQKNL